MDAEVAVVGTGTMGAMAAWRLAEGGHSVIAFERYGIGHDRSAVGGESRIFRTAYLEGPEYVPILRRSEELWRELEKVSGWSLLTMTGALMIGEDGSPHMTNVLESVRRFDLAHEILGRDAMAARFPQHRLDAGQFAVLDHAAGVLRPEFAVIAAAERARELGATILPHTPVLEVLPDDDGVTVRTAERTYRVRQAILTAGPWTARIAPQYEGRIRAERIVMTWFGAAEPARFTPDAFPVFIRDHGDVDVFGIPTVDGGSVKVALAGSRGAIGEPEQLDFDVPPAKLARICDLVGHDVDGLHDYPHRVSVHMDGFSTDGDPVVGPLPGVPNVLVFAGFSGHGFKMSTAMGQIAHDLVTTGETKLPITHLDPARLTPTPTPTPQR